MKKLLKKLRDWLIVKMGGVTRENAESILEYWDKDVHKLAILTEMNASLEQTNNSLSGENNRLKMELDRNPPAWKMLQADENLPLATLCAEKVFQQTPDTDIELVQFVREELELKLLDGVKPFIDYQFKNDFAGNTRARATLQLLKGPAPIWGPGE